MDKTKVNSEVTHGNTGLEKVLKDMAEELHPKKLGKTYYCLKSDADYYVDFYNKYHEIYSDGSSNIQSTITAALAVADDWDEIFVAPGDWDEGAVLAVTQEGLRIFGPSDNENQHRAMIYSSSASHHLMTVNAHHVTVEGLGFTQTKDTYNGIMWSTTASYHKGVVRNCRFDGYGAGEYGVHLGSTYDSPDMVVEKNRFHSWQTAALYYNTTRGVVRDNLVHTVAAKIGIQVAQTGGNRPGGFIYKNYVLGVNSTDTGISVAAVNAGNIHLSNNYVVGCGTADISQFANGQYSGTENYAASDAGGAIIDIDS